MGATQIVRIRMENNMLKWFVHVECVPLTVKLGISLIILTPMKILQRNLNRSMFVVWEMKRNVSVVHLIVVTWSSSQPACLLPDVPLCWSLCHLTEGAWFHLLGYVNSQNSHIWASENPNAIHEEPLHSEKIGVWCGMSWRRIIGPIFFDAAVTTAAYMEIFNTFVNQLDDEEL